MELHKFVQDIFFLSTIGLFTLEHFSIHAYVDTCECWSQFIFVLHTLIALNFSLISSSTNTIFGVFLWVFSFE